MGKSKNTSISPHSIAFIFYAVYRKYIKVYIFEPFMVLSAGIKNIFRKFSGRKYVFFKCNFFHHKIYFSYIFTLIIECSMPTFPIIKLNTIEIRFHALIVILAIALIIFDTDFNRKFKNYKFDLIC